jgi:hypothetical protein
MAQHTVRESSLMLRKEEKGGWQCCQMCEGFINISSFHQHIPGSTMSNSREGAKYEPLLSAEGQQWLRDERQRQFSNESQISELLVASPMISDILNTQIRNHQSEFDYITTYQKHLTDALQQKNLGLKEYNEECDALGNQSLPILQQLHVLERQRRAIESDLLEEYASHKRQRAEEPDKDFFERACRDSRLDLPTGNGCICKAEKVGLQRDKLQCE